MTEALRVTPTSRKAESRGHCCILLGLYDGGATIDQQLASFSDQTYRDWSLVVSDDGSRDDGPAKVEAFAESLAEHRVRLVSGPQAGFCANFLSMFDRVPECAAFAALSDQDDRWLPEKLERGIERLRGIEPGRPAFYGGRTVICDAHLRPLRRSPFFRLPPSFANALVQNIAGGNTMILNRAAIDLVAEVAHAAHGLPAHDWFIYQVVTAAGGVVIYDREPMVLYRQHGLNLIGANDGAAAQFTRLKGLLSGRFSGWTQANMESLRHMEHRMTPEARRVFADFDAARRGGLKSRLTALSRSGIYRQTRKGSIALWLAAALNRL